MHGEILDGIPRTNLHIPQHRKLCWSGCKTWDTSPCCRILRPLYGCMGMDIIIFTIGSLYCSITLEGEDGTILLDYSKNIITKETMKLLFNLVCALVYCTVSLRTISPRPVP